MVFIIVFIVRIIAAEPKWREGMGPARRSPLGRRRPVQVLQKDIVGFANTLELSCGIGITRVLVWVCAQSKL